MGCGGSAYPGIRGQARRLPLLAMDYPPANSPSHTQMFRALVMVSGHDPSDFRVEFPDDDHVRVHGPHGTATYSRQAWVSRFGKHLYEGVFDEVAV